MAAAKELSVMLENKRGALAELCSRLAEKAVNILGLMVPEQAGTASGSKAEKNCPAVVSENPTIVCEPFRVRLKYLYQVVSFLIA